MSQYDAIVIGGGHNSLTTAALLAKKGQKVLLLEKRKNLGGLAESREFHAGYRTAGLLHDTTAVRRMVLDSLALEKHGLEISKESARFFSPMKDGPGVVISRDAKRTAEEIGKIAPDDGDRYPAYLDFVSRVGRFVDNLMTDTPPNLIEGGFTDLLSLGKKAVALRLLGKKDMVELIRVSAMATGDFLAEWFRSDQVKAALSGPAIYSSTTGPWSPGTTFNLLLWESLAKNPVVGGPAKLVEALEKAAIANGVEIRTESEVTELKMTGEGEVKGVVLSDGETIESAAVVSGLDAKSTLLNLVPSLFVGDQLEHRVTHIRSRGTTAALHLALNAPLKFAGRDEEFTYIRTGEHLDDLERAQDAVKYGEFSEEPALEIYVPSTEDASYAPEGGATVQVLVHFAPYHLRAGWTDETKKALESRVMNVLERYAPGVSQSVVGKEMLSPLDIEKEYGTTEGHLFHGEHALDQMLVRPIPECAQYKTPFKGLYLCGGATFPGGGITCAPGALAVPHILKG